MKFTGGAKQTLKLWQEWASSLSQVEHLGPFQFLHCFCMIAASGLHSSVAASSVQELDSDTSGAISFDEFTHPEEAPILTSCLQ